MIENWTIFKIRLKRQILEAIVILYCFLMTLSAMNHPLSPANDPGDMIHQSLYQLSQITITPTEGLPHHDPLD